MFDKLKKKLRIQRDAKLTARMKSYRDQDFMELKRRMMALQKRMTDQAADHKEDRRILEDRLTVTIQERDILARKLELAKCELEGLAEVIERDRRRVEAETAIEARKIAAATAGMRFEGE